MSDINQVRSSLRSHNLGRPARDLPPIPSNASKEQLLQLLENNWGRVADGPGVVKSEAAWLQKLATATNADASVRAAILAKIGTLSADQVQEGGVRDFVNALRQADQIVLTGGTADGTGLPQQPVTPGTSTSGPGVLGTMGTEFNPIKQVGPRYRDARDTLDDLKQNWAARSNLSDNQIDRHIDFARQAKGTAPEKLDPAKLPTLQAGDKADKAFATPLVDNPYKTLSYAALGIKADTPPAEIEAKLAQSPLKPLAPLLDHTVKTELPTHMDRGPDGALRANVVVYSDKQSGYSGLVERVHAIGDTGVMGTPKTHFEAVRKKEPGPGRPNNINENLTATNLDSTHRGTSWAVYDERGNPLVAAADWPIGYQETYPSGSATYLMGGYRMDLRDMKLLGLEGLSEADKLQYKSRAAKIGKAYGALAQARIPFSSGSRYNYDTDYHVNNLNIDRGNVVNDYTRILGLKHDAQVQDPDDPTKMINPGEYARALSLYCAEGSEAVEAMIMNARPDENYAAMADIHVKAVIDDFKQRFGALAEVGPELKEAVGRLDPKDYLDTDQFMQAVGEEAKRAGVNLRELQRRHSLFVDQRKGWDALVTAGYLNAEERRNLAAAWGSRNTYVEYTPMQKVPQGHKPPIDLQPEGISQDMRNPGAGLTTVPLGLPELTMADFAINAPRRVLGGNVEAMLKQGLAQVPAEQKMQVKGALLQMMSKHLEDTRLPKFSDAEKAALMGDDAKMAATFGRYYAAAVQAGALASGEMNGALKKQLRFEYLAPKDGEAVTPEDKALGKQQQEAVDNLFKAYGQVVADFRLDEGALYAKLAAMSKDLQQEKFTYFYPEGKKEANLYMALAPHTQPALRHLQGLDMGLPGSPRFPFHSTGTSFEGYFFPAGMAKDDVRTAFEAAQPAAPVRVEQAADPNFTPPD